MRILKPVFNLGLSISLMATTSFFGNTQTAANYEGFKVPNFIPKVQDANVANLIGFIETPINKSTGGLNSSIPITSVTIGDFPINVNLNYISGNGIGALQEAGSYGLGWSMSAFGVLTHQINGRNDLSSTGYKNNLSLISEFNNIDYAQEIPSAKQGIISQAMGSANVPPTDLQPDLWSFYGPGISGSFFLDYNSISSIGYAEPVMIPKSNLKPQKTGQNEWSVFDQNGNQYIYGGTGFFVMTDNDGLLADETHNSIRQINYYLKKIITYNQEEISYHYTSYSYKRSYIANEVRNIDVSTNVSFHDETIFSNTNTVHGMALTQIDFPSGKIKFIKSSQSREDFNSGGPKATDRIELYDNINTTIPKKCWKLNYDYFSTGSSYLDKRLRLLSVQLDCEAQNPTKKYSFSYNNTPLPRKNTKNYDYWGFPNESNNNTIVPTHQEKGAYIRHIVYGADRESDWNGGKAGILEQITYPTGGYSTFEFESNTINEPYFDKTNDQKSFSAQYSSTNSNGNVYTYYFTIDFDQVLSINHTYSKIDNNQQDPALSNTQIILTSNNSVKYSTSANTNQFIWLEAGQYKCEIALDFNTQSSFDLQFRKHNGSFSENKPVGGVRIKTVTHQNDIDPQKNIVKHYYYNISHNDSKSSGELNDPSITNKASISGYAVPSSNCSSATPHTVYNYSVSSIGEPIQSTTYSRVEEQIGANNGYQSFIFSTPHNTPSITGGIPTTSTSYKRGLLLSQKTFDSSNNLVQKTENVYSYVGAQSLQGRIVKYQSSPVYCTSTGGSIPTINTNGRLYNAQYDLKSEWIQLNTKTTTGYNSSLTNVQTKEFQFHPYTLYLTPHFLPISTVTTLSNNAIEWETTTIYSFDLNNGAGLSQINRLIPIEITKSETKNNITRVLESQVRVLENFGSRPQIEELLTLPLNNPILKTSFTPVTYSNGNFYYDSRYKKNISFSKYTSNGNMEEYQQADNTNNAIIWGYHQQHPIAMASNTNRNEIAYTSFEINNSSNWDHTKHAGDLYGWDKRSSQITTNDPFTGNSCVQLTSTNGPEKSIVGINQTKRYKVSAWVKTNHASSNAQLKAFTFLKNGGGANSPYYLNPTYTSGTANLETVSIGNTNNKWVYIELEIEIPTSTPSGDEWGINISFQNNTSQTLWIDEVRILPVDAQMQTYTYQYPYGKTSDCDVRNNRTIYEYDPYGRLKLIRDHNGHIVKSAEYHYK